MIDTFIDQRQREDIITAVRSDLKCLADSVEVLKSIKEYQFPRALSLLSVDKMREEINQRMALVRQDYSLTEAERGERLQRWINIKQLAARHISTITEILGRWPSIVWHYNEAGDNYFTEAEQVEQVAEELATHPVPELARQHRQLIDEAMTGIKRLGDFEAENDLFDLPLSRLAAMTDEQLAGAWLDGSIKRPASRYTPQQYSRHKIL